MKKLFTLMLGIVIISSSSVFAKRYLVQKGGVGDATWRSAGIGETLVDLSVAAKTFDAWHAAVSASDEVWVAKGTYVLTASITLKTGEQLYGGFIGTELAVSNRIKGANAWDFTSATILDGNNLYVIFNNSAALANPTLIDGFTATNGLNGTSGYNMSGAGAKLNGNMTMQNCIVSYCVSAYTSGTGGGGVGLNAGSSLINSYIHHNTSAAAKNCGGVYMFAGSTMTGCTIDSNTAPNNCGGVYMFNNAADGVAPILQNCIISNNVATSGNAGGFMAYTSAATKKFTNQVVISGCTITGNSTSTISGGGVYINDAFSPNGYLFTNCTIQNNTSATTGGGVFSNTATSAVLDKCKIINNNSTTSGSAIYSVIPLTLTNCLIFGNKGVDFMNFAATGTASVYNCTLASNRAVDGTTPVGINFPSSTNASTFTNCLFYDCSALPITSPTAPAVTYCGFDITLPSYALAGCIATIYSSSFKDVTNSDYRLAAGSTAIDAGTTIAATSPDILGQTRSAIYDMGAYEFYIPDVFTWAGTGNWSNTANWSPASLPTSLSDVLISSGTIAIDADASMFSLVANPGVQISLNAEKKLSVSILKLNSDATGTATFLDNGTTTISCTTNVQQFLTGYTGTSHRANWYLSSPVSRAKAAVFNVAGLTNKMTSWDETIPNYLTQFSSNSTSLIPGKGYVTFIGGADATYTFTGGSLNNGSIPVTVTRTGTTAGQRGFNLVGNPYPSYLNWNTAQASATNVRPTIWYRTRTSGGDMTFDTYDGTTGTGNGANGVVSQYIPPMQAFWMRVDVDGLAATLTFDNSQRSHQDQSLAANRLRAPKLADNQLVRLKVSNGINNDEAIIIADPNAQDTFDYFDSQKMSNDNVNIPEIFTLAGTEELVINHMNSLAGNKELPLGFRPGKSSDFSIEATQISNFDSNVKVMLLDKLRGVEHELTVGSPYAFTSDAAATNDRFSVIFKTTSIATDLTKTEDKGVLVYRNFNNHIAVICNQGIDDQSTVSVYNAVGQKMSTQKLTKTTTEIKQTLTAGVYLVAVHNGGQTVTEKVIIK